MSASKNLLKRPGVREGLDRAEQKVRWGTFKPGDKMWIYFPKTPSVSTSSETGDDFWCYVTRPFDDGNGFRTLNMGMFCESKSTFGSAFVLSLPRGAAENISNLLWVFQILLGAATGLRILVDHEPTQDDNINRCLGPGKCLATIDFLEAAPALEDLPDIDT